MKILINFESLTNIFFKETKMNYITNSTGFPSTRCTKDNRNSVGTIFTKGKLYRKQL